MVSLDLSGLECTTAWEFWTDDHKFGFRLKSRELTKAINLCAKADSLEIGGIIVGRYIDDYSCAEVVSLLEPPSDSRSMPTRFLRGIRGLQSLLDQFWVSKSGYYLGEWHFHPHGEPIPSSLDRETMGKIANNTETHCPEPILLIIGGDSSSICLRVFVWHTNLLQELHLDSEAAFSGERVG